VLEAATPGRCAVDDVFRRAGIPLSGCHRETTDDGLLVPAPALVAAVRVHDTTGPVVPASPGFWALVGALEDVACVRDGHTRDLVVRRLPFEVVRFANRRTDVASILRTCLDFADGTDRLLAELAAQDGVDAAPVRWVAALLAIGGVRGYGP
jgi:effector-associated domain 2 (EAD2)-containing protein